MILTQKNAKKDSFFAQIPAMVEQTGQRRR
jgi:hypothetical protein